MTREATFCCMPVLTLMGHLGLVYSYWFPTCVTVLRKAVVEAGQAVWLRFPHDVPLSTELLGALLAGEVLHVPCSTLGFCALVCENNLGTRKGWLTSYINFGIGKCECAVVYPGYE